MQAASFLRNGGRGYGRLALILVLLAYVFVGGVGGFASSGSGHSWQETVHIPTADQEVGFGGETHFHHYQYTERKRGVVRHTSDPTVGISPPTLAGKGDVAGNNLAAFVHFVLNYLTGARVPGLLLETQTVAIANPEWWLRTVVLHL